MRILKIIFLILLGIVLCFLALANRDPITLRLIPDFLTPIIDLPSLQIPVFVALFGGILLGLFVGFIWEWIREHQHRSTAQRNKNKIKELEDGISQSGNSLVTQDDVLSILEKSSQPK